MSPRKSAQSEKSSSSPVHVSTGPAQSISNPSGSKESSAETKPTPGPVSNNAQVSEVSKSSSNLRPSQMKQELDDREAGNMPPIIEEGQEPPHPDVLPA